jgi:3-methyladenine DNA glycosylase AlkD
MNQTPGSAGTAVPDVGALSLQSRLRSAMSAAGDPVRARSQQAYMKSAMPYYGVSSPELKALLRPLLKGFRPTSREVWEATVRGLWDGATHREERYAAIAFAQHPGAKKWRDPDALGLYEHLVTTGAWWDLVDVVASDLVGPVLLSYRRKTTPLMRDWAVSDDLWLRRAAVISQLKHGADTDLDLLSYAIEVNVDDTSFWLRKAIGWALRQYARTDPEWVRAEVDLLGSRLSGLSRREALKHLGGTE